MTGHLLVSIDPFYGRELTFFVRVDLFFTVFFFFYIFDSITPFTQIHEIGKLISSMTELGNAKYYIMQFLALLLNTC